MRLILAILSIAVLSACAGAGPTPDEAPSAQLEPGIYDTDTGEKLGADELYDRLADHRFVVVGERHDDAWHHEIEERILRGVAERSERVALGLEMFQRPYQGPLDAYISGEIDEEEMLAQTEYAERWGFDVEFYAPLWRFARQQGYPVIALNARRELSRKISKVGLEGLSEQEQADIPELDLSNEQHRSYVRRAFEQHDMDMSDETFEKFYSAQVLWDETMADTAVRFARANPDLDTMVLVAGGAHSHKAFGIPPRIERRLDGADAAVSVQPVNLQRADQRATSLDEWSEAADFVWVGR